MKKIKLLVVFLVIALTTSIAIISGCDSYGPNDVGYYFSDSTQELVDYDETTHNIDEAGYYYYFTAKSTTTIDLSIRIAFDNSMYQTMYLYVNDEQVGSDTDTGIYSFVFSDLSLTKGDKLTLHFFATNSFYIFEEEPDIQVFTIDNYTINELTTV